MPNILIINPFLDKLSTLNTIFMLVLHFSPIKMEFNFSLLLCRLFGTKCDKCSQSFSKNDFVMRAKTKIYHIECFRCSACERQLIPGDEFALREDGLFCKEDHEVLEKATNGENNNNNTNLNNNNSLHHNEGSNSGMSNCFFGYKVVN